MKNFIYTNHKDGGPPVVIVAKGILEADAKFKKITGIDPAKASYIGCAIKKG